MSTTNNLAYGSYTAMTVTNLQSLASDSSDPFAGWQSARVDNQSSVKALDFEILIDLSITTGTVSGDSAVYVFLIPWMTTDGGTTWIPGGNFATTTAPAGTEGTASISIPNSMKGPFALPVKVQSQSVQGLFTVSQMCGGIVPDGWSLAIYNNCGIALLTGQIVAYRAITTTNN